MQVINLMAVTKGENQANQLIEGFILVYCSGKALRHNYTNDGIHSLV